MINVVRSVEKKSDFSNNWYWDNELFVRKWSWGLSLTIYKNKSIEMRVWKIKKEHVEDLKENTERYVYNLRVGKQLLMFDTF
jgi:hypothetical protein